MRTLILAATLGLSITAFAGKLPTGSDTVAPVAKSTAAAEVTLSELKMQKRFGVGMSAGGPLSVLGLLVDVNLTEVFSIGLGVGTGLDYSTSMIEARYFLPGKWVSP